MKGKTRLLLCISLLISCAHAQVQQAWVARHSSPGSHDDTPVSVLLDNAQNVYVAGHSVYTNVSGRATLDYAIVKYDPNGIPLWVARYNGTNDMDDYVAACVVDGTGHVYVTGWSSTNRSPRGAMGTVKFDSAGTRIWAVHYQGTNRFDNRATALKVDGGGNVYVAGFTWPPYEFTTIKYNASGAPIWVTRYTNAGGFGPGAVVMDIDSAGNVYVSGRSEAQMSGEAYTTIKYDGNGNQLWVMHYTNPDTYRSETPRAIVVDNIANVVVTGTGGTVKYDTAGNQLWADPDWYGAALAFDTSGNAYVTGQYPSYAYQFATVKYDQTGNRLWWSRYISSDRWIRYDFPTAIAVDSNRNVYVTGYTGGTNDPGILASDDFQTIKYDSSGNLSWSKLYHHTNSPPYIAGDRANALALDGSGNVYVTGSSVGYHAGVSDAWTDDYATVKYTQTSVPGIPTIITPPQHQSAPENTDVTFTVQATGNLPLRYQWRFNGRSLPNETNSTLVLTSVQLHEAGGYSVVVSNSLGRTISPEAQLTVLARARIDYISAGGTVLAGQLFTFYSGASGTPPLHYQWRHNGVDIPDANNNFLQLTNIHPSQAGDYSLVVTNNYGAATGSVSRLEVEIFRFNSQPPPYTSAVAGSTFSFFVGVSGKAPFQFQWRRNGQPIGQTNASIFFGSVHPTNAGTYSVEVSNEYGSMVSSNAVLEVHPLRITRHPQSQSVQVDECTSLIVEAQSFSQTQYQWQLNGSNLPGETNAALTFTAVQLADAGDYRVIVSNTYGALTSAVARLTVGLESPVGKWTWRNPLPQGNGLRAVAYGNGRFVAVGGYGAIVTSTDGLGWEDRSVRAGNFNAVAFGNGQFVAVGDQEIVFASSNGLDWVCRRAPQGPPGSLSNNFTSVLFGNGVFVAAGSAGVFSSSNALAWTKNSSAPSAFSQAFGNGEFIAASVGGIYSLSNNGLGWTRISTLSLGTLLFANGEFLGWAPNGFLQYRLYASPDGRTWTLRHTAAVWQVKAFAYGAGKYLTINAQSILSSPDTFQWATNVLNTTNIMWNLGFGGDRFVAVGENGNIITSTDGVNWQRASWATDDNIRAVAWGGDQYVAVGNGGRIWRSHDARRWSTAAITSRNLRGVAYGLNRFVAVGASGGIISSTDGVNWAEQPFGPGSFYGITFGGNLFVAVGDDNDEDEAYIIRSSDGRNWAGLRLSAYQRLQGVTWGNNLFVATGRQGLILTSPNGVIWSRRTSGTVAYLEAATYGNGLYIASGEDGAVCISSNGIDWVATRVPSPADINVYPSWEAVAYGAGHFILGGDTGEILVSTNGVDWIRSFHGSDNGLRGAMFARGAFIVIGNNETILQSAPLLPLLEVRGLNEEGFELLIDAPPNRNYLLQGSSDFINWSDLFNFNNTSRRTFYFDDDAPDLSRRFYRVIEE